jgi:NAD-dependent deacetylase
MNNTAPSTVPPLLADALAKARDIVVLTGAGMSAESGVPTFRDALQGLWARFDPEQLATEAAWRADRESVWAWYEWRRSQVLRAQPHAGHRALAAMARARRVTIVTQNVDDLHERAGSAGVIHVHGSLFAPHCDHCGAPGELEDAPLPDTAGEPPARLAPPRCAHCADGHLRPGVVWFGEALPPQAWSQATHAVERADLLLVVGTSGLVHPAAGLPDRARARGAFVAEINPLETPISPLASVSWRAGAAAGLAALAAAPGAPAPAGDGAR